LHTRESCEVQRRRRYLLPIPGRRRRRPAAATNKVGGEEELAGGTRVGVVRTKSAELPPRGDLGSLLRGDRKKEVALYL
jgi:hypothetical protein